LGRLEDLRAMREARFVRAVAKPVTKPVNVVTKSVTKSPAVTKPNSVTRKVGRPPIGDVAMSAAERQRKSRARERW